jgi:hypothetical protein
MRLVNAIPGKSSFQRRMCFCAAKRITDYIKDHIKDHIKDYIKDHIKDHIKDYIKDDALPSGTTHPTSDWHDCLPGNP